MVEEDEYRSTYHRVNDRRCVFEKAILSRRCNCTCSSRFFLADREGISCRSAAAHGRCSRLLSLLHDSARFALKLKSIDGELPHTKEIKVQTGGLLGLQKQVHPQLADQNDVGDIAGLIARGVHLFGALEKFPFQDIVKSIVSFQTRRKRSRS